MLRMLSSTAVLAALSFASISHTAYGVDPGRIGIGTSTSPTSATFIAPSSSLSPGLIPGAPGTSGTSLPPLLRDRMSPSGTLGVAPSLFPTPGTPGFPNMPSRGPRWRLGVYSQDTNIGVKILRTTANSPADRAGLEANDIIVNVAGYQVGIVNGQQYDCGNEFEMRADSQGNCMLLVFDNRSRTLVNLPIQLESRLAQITGTIAYRNRIVLPQNAVALVELREAPTSGGAGICLGRQEINDFNQIPIPFAVEYDPLDVNPRRNYVVNATITANGVPLFTTVQQYAVLTNGRPQTAALEVQRATDPQTAATDARSQIEQQIYNYFRTYFGRDPTPQEMPLWTAQVTERGRSLFDVQADMASNDKVWNRCQQDDQRYVELLSESILGKKPTPEELDYWVYQYQKSGGVRRQLAEDFMTAAGVPR